jgi:hypothetical protein
VGVAKISGNVKKSFTQLSKVLFGRSNYGSDE